MARLLDTFTQWWEYRRIHCGNCNKVFVTEPGDDSAEREIQGRTYVWVTCPECGHMVVVGKPERG